MFQIGHYGVVTPDQREVVLGLAQVPGRDRISGQADVLEAFGATDGLSLGLSLLRRAAEEHDPDDVELALMVCTTFGFEQGHLPLLLEMSSAEWHHSHEDVVWYLGGNYQSPEVVEALIHATEWIPGYLAFDDTRALARKAVWELGKQPGPRARRALEQIGIWATGALAEDVRHQLER